MKVSPGGQLVRSANESFLREGRALPDYLGGITSESSRVSVRGSFPARYPFFCSKKARMSSDCCVVNLAPAYAAIGPLISPHGASNFAPAYNCCHEVPVSAGPAPPSRFAPWHGEQEC